MTVLGGYYQFIKVMNKKKKEINDFVENNECDLALIKLNEYEELYKYDIDIYSTRAVIHTLQNNLEQAERILEEALAKKPFNYDLNYNMGMVYYLKKDIFKSLDYFINSVKYSNDYEQKDNALATVENLLDNLHAFNLQEDDVKEIESIVEFINYLNSDAYENIDNRYFPLAQKGIEKKYLIGDSFLEKNNHKYFVGYNNCNAVQSYPIELYHKVNTETIKARIVEKKLDVKIEKPCAIPILIKDYETIVNFSINKEKFKFQKLVPNRFYYFPIRDTGNLSIESNDTILVGDKLDFDDNNKIKLVIGMFIDGFSQSIIEGEDFEKLMPNTYNFFSEGTICNNFSTNGEWTLPSVASYFTGKYTTNHNLFNPNHNYDIGRNYPLISELYKENGYLTFQACGNWRKSPAYGYARGFDRTLYQNGAYGGMSCEETIIETIDQLDAFENRSHFCWLSFNELHKVGDIIRPTISSQISNSVYCKTLCRNSQKSVVHKYDERKIERYITEIKRLDRYFKILFDYIEERFKDDEILVTLFSDHGQSYLNNKKYFENEKRIKVPLLIRGAGVNQGYCNETIEAVDVFPTMLKLCNIKQHENVDGQVPRYFGGDKERKFAYTESIYPKKTYKALINDSKHRFVFETKEPCDNDGRVSIIGSSIKLINSETEEDEQNLYRDKVEEYTKVVLEHIREYIKI